MQFDEPMVQWHFAVWEWLLRNFGGAEFLQKQKLILPSRGFFPEGLTNDRAGVARVFTRVKEYMGLADWPCRLEPLDNTESAENLIRRHVPTAQWQGHGPAGTFEWSEEEVVIRYSTKNTKDVTSLVATLCHELCHYLLHTAKSDPPGGWQDHEFHTDVACSFTGFGVFVSNSAFRYQQWTDGEGGGWSSSRQGYLSETEHAYGMAIFCLLTEISPAMALPFLSVNGAEYFNLALHDLQHRDKEFAVLRAITANALSIGQATVFPDLPRSGTRKIKEGSPKLGHADLEALTFRNPENEPLWQFYTDLVEVQDGGEHAEREFAALESLPQRLRHLLLAVRFDLLQKAQGLQGAVLMDTPRMAEDSERMTRMTAQAFVSLGEAARARILMSLIPGIAVHLQDLEAAEREDRLDEFVSPLDRDEEWLGCGGSFVPEMRRQVRDHAEELLYPPTR